VIQENHLFNADGHREAPAVIHIDDINGVAGLPSEDLIDTNAIGREVKETVGIICGPIADNRANEDHYALPPLDRYRRVAVQANERRQCK
jgi:hypothetical protein